MPSIWQCLRIVNINVRGHSPTISIPDRFGFNPTPGLCCFSGHELVHMKDKGAIAIFAAVSQLSPEALTKLFERVYDVGFDVSPRNATLLIWKPIQSIVTASSCVNELNLCSSSLNSGASVGSMAAVCRLCGTQASLWSTIQ